MNAKTTQVIQDALQLPEGDRRRLLQELIATFDDRQPFNDEDEQAWNGELLRRMDAAHDGEPGIPAEDVFAKLHAKLRQG